MKQVAIITGASRGIGAATAQLLASKEYEVCVNYNKSKKHAEEIVETILGHGGKAFAVQADLSDEKNILDLFNQVDKKLGYVTALINNAGINGGLSLVEDITAERLHSVFSTNVFSTFFCCREAVKRMKKNGGGNIVNVASEAARFGGSQAAHYAASKAAINTFTIGFAREVAMDNIRVNAVSPGVIDTDIHALSSEERITQLMNTLPMKRMGTTNEVAELIAWLLSDAASYVSGAIIPITGSR
jgi:NAD(P)-dependent dehydrogenase (short-subunit alcohol dehydrogenase family)